MDKNKDEKSVISILETTADDGKDKLVTPARKFIIDVQPVIVYAGRVMVIDLEEAS